MSRNGMWIMGAMICALYSSPSAEAQSDPPENTPALILSDGGTTCGEYTTAGPGDQAHMEEWILGFISGLNVGSTGTFRMVGDRYDINSIPAWLMNFCSAHALDSLGAAAYALRKDFKDHGLVGHYP